MVTRAWLGAAIALAGCDPTSFRDCAIACTAESGCPDGFACGAEGYCRAAGQTASCSDLDANPTVTLQETDDAIAVGGSIGCGDPTTSVTRDNVWYRTFRLADFGLAKPFHVSRVTFAVESSTQSVPIHVDVGSYGGTVGGSVLDRTLMTSLASASVTVPASSTGQMVSATVQADIPAGGVLVAQVAAPDLKSTNGTFRLGSSASGESAPGYISSTACAITVPESTAMAGKPNAHIIIAVTGTE